MVFLFAEYGDFGGLPFDPTETTGKIGTKKMRKLEMKAEKKALREVNYAVVTLHYKYTTLLYITKAHQLF